ncbi:MAG: threonine ammonia-lyase, biosynthetic [Candidatus Dactylopiibacterium sp.]|nr:threonine ammonia-lyase, biosynthetic [Candidatus Dactylopiibacterium sp.]
MSAVAPPDDYLVRILDARVYEAAVETPLDFAPALSRRCGHRIWLKREDMQPVFSFKLRGAYNKMARLSEAQRARGVICASAGNHAQGVALSAQKLGCRAVIVMPQATPSIKVDAVRARGGEVVLAGDSFDDAYAHACEIAGRDGLTFVHPFDDPDVIAGQGTIGVEILRQHAGPIDAVFCAVGGGGLLAGVAAYIKRIRPQTRLIGVEAVDSDAMAQSLARGERVQLAQVGLFADGAAVKLVGAESFRLCQQYVDEVICVDNDAICAAIKDAFEDSRAILEPAGALALAGAKAWLAREGGEGRSVVAVASGANMNFDRLRFVAERAELGEQREAILAVTIPERPGSFKAFCRLLGGRSITEFNYRFSEGGDAHVFVGVAIARRAEAADLLARLAAEGLPALDLTDNEMAKMHTRYTVGGRAPSARHERVYRFTFAERPGALLRFLEALRSDWNISLFHYRNHGADFGRALVGLQVPPDSGSAFTQFLERAGYEYVEETDNPAYRLFLR